MMLYCRLLGAVLLVCTGFAAGQAYCQRLCGAILVLYFFLVILSTLLLLLGGNGG